MNQTKSPPPPRLWKKKHGIEKERGREQETEKVRSKTRKILSFFLPPLASLPYPLAIALSLSPPPVSVSASENGFFLHFLEGNKKIKCFRTSLMRKSVFYLTLAGLAPWLWPPLRPPLSSSPSWRELPSPEGARRDPKCFVGPGESFGD